MTEGGDKVLRAFEALPSNREKTAVLTAMFFHLMGCKDDAGRGRQVGVMVGGCACSAPSEPRPTVHIMGGDEDDEEVAAPKAFTTVTELLSRPASVWR